MAVQNAINSATRRRNVKPVTSIIRADLTRDVDCSGMAVPPEDGQFILVAGDVGSHSTKLFNSTTGGITAVSNEAAQLKMVWSSAMRSDRQAIGETRVPCLPWLGDMEIETSLFLFTSGVGTLATQYPIGEFVSVEALDVAGNAVPVLQGSDARLLISPMANAATGFAFGVVTGYGAGDGSKTLVGGVGSNNNNNAKLRIRLFNGAREIA